MSFGFTPVWWITLFVASKLSFDPHEPNYSSLSLKLSSEMCMDYDSAESIGFYFSTRIGSVMLQKFMAELLFCYWSVKDLFVEKPVVSY